MKNRSSSIIGVLMLMVLGSAPALGQWAVADAANVAQTTLTAKNTAQQLKKQIEQMTADAERWKKQLQSLRELGWEDSYKLRQHLDYFDSVKGKVDSLAFDYREMDRRFNNLYSRKGEPFEKKFADWNKQTDDSIRAAMTSHGALKDSRRTIVSVAELVEKQRRAQGDLAAIQTLGELAAIQSRQLEDLKTVIALDSRAKQSQLMEERSHKKTSKDFEAFLMSDVGKKEKARPMRKLPKLGEAIQ